MISEMIVKCGTSDKEDHRERLMAQSSEEEGRRACSTSKKNIRCMHGRKEAQMKTET